MAVWIYEGNNTEGEYRAGEIEAESKEEAKTRLSSIGVKPFQLKKKQKEIEIVIPGITDKVPLKSMVVFTRQMATMIDAGLPLIKCLELLGSQEPNPQLKKTLLAVKASVEGGQSFSDSLAKHPKVFEELYINLIRAGELGRILDTIMTRLAEYIEKAAETRAKIKGAMKQVDGLIIRNVTKSITASFAADCSASKAKHRDFKTRDTEGPKTHGLPHESKQQRHDQQEKARKPPRKQVKTP